MLCCQVVRWEGSPSTSSNASTRSRGNLCASCCCICVCRPTLSRFGINSSNVTRGSRSFTASLVHQSPVLLERRRVIPCPLLAKSPFAGRWFARPLPAQAYPWVYVDNLTWLASETRLLNQLLLDATEFCHSLCLPIDWTKSFCWGTTKDIRSFWARLPVPGGPAGSRLKLVNEAKDLGVAFRFSRVGGLGRAAARIAEGLQRLKRLQRQTPPTPKCGTSCPDRSMAGGIVRLGGSPCTGD